MRRPRKKDTESPHSFANNKRLSADTKQWCIPVGGLVHHLLVHCLLAGTSMRHAKVRSRQYSSKHIAACEILGLLRREDAGVHIVIYHMTDVGRKAVDLLEAKVKLMPYTEDEAKVQIALGTASANALTKGGKGEMYNVLKGHKTIRVPVKINKERYEYHQHKTW